MVEESYPHNRAVAQRERKAQRKAREQQVSERRAELMEQVYRQHLARLEAVGHPSDKAALADALGQVHERQTYRVPEWIRPSSGGSPKSKANDTFSFGFHGCGSMSDRGPDMAMLVPGSSNLELALVHKRRARKLAGTLARLRC